MKHNSSSQNSCSQVCCLVCATKVRWNTRWWKWETNQAPLSNTGTLVNMPGTLVKKYRYPRHRQNINTKHPRQKIFFLGAIVQRWNVPRSRDLHWMFLMPPCIFPDKTFRILASTDWMRVLFRPESTSASVAILTRYPAGTLVRFTTVF